MEQKEDLEINLGFLVREVIRKAWIIVLATIVCAAGMFCFSNFVKDPVYESSVKVYVNNLSDKNDSGSISSSDIQGARSLVDTYISILKTYDTLNLIAEKSGVSYTADQILKMISAGSVNNTEIFYITVEAHSPEEAYRIASSIIEVLPKRISDIVNGSEVSVVQYPLIPAEPSGPDKVRDTLIGAALGFVISCALIVVYKIFDKRINDDNYPSDAYGIKALANIPSMTEHSGKKYGYGSNPKSKKAMSKYTRDEQVPCDKLPFRTAEAYKMLRTSLFKAFGDERGCQVIGVTSHNPGEGKSTTALNLSYSIAMAGKKVLLIDADLRKPVVAKRLKLQTEPGLYDMIKENVEGAIQTSPYIENWKVLTAGTTVDTPSEILGSYSMSKLLGKLKQDFDYIIVDLPPTNVVTDAMAISGFLDGMILAIMNGVTTKVELDQTMRHISISDAHLLGYVVTKSKLDEKLGRYGKYGKYGKYKRYGSDYYQSKTEEE